METLVEFVRRHLQAERDAACIISDGGYDPQTWRHGSEKGDAILLFADDHMIGDPPDAIEEGDHPFAVVMNSRAEYRHIMYWDPKRIVADIDAKLAILRMYENAVKQAEVIKQETWNSAVDWASKSTMQWVVRYLAQPFAGREGWQEEWRLHEPYTAQ